jgi:uncharacterized protein YndB with AHSA1/START domain
MPSATRTISINTTPEKAFAIFAVPANDKGWRPAVKEITATGAPRVGARIHQVVEGPGGRGNAADIEITAYEPLTRYAFSVVAGPARPQGEYRFSPTAGGVEVSVSLKADLGGIKKFLLGGPVQSSMNGEMAALDKGEGHARRRCSRGAWRGRLGFRRGATPAPVRRERWRTTCSRRPTPRRAWRAC